MDIITVKKVSDCLSAVLEDSDFSVSSDRMATTKKLARLILEEVKSGEEALQTFSSRINKVLLEIIDKTASCSKFSSRKERMWREFHSIRCSILKDLWLEFLVELNVKEEDPLLMQYIFEKTFDVVLKSKFSTPSKGNEVRELSHDEHNALRYTAGYVPHALINKVSKGSNTYKEEFLTCLSNMGVKGENPDEEDTFQAFTKKWITAVNRGGLFFIKDEVYMFFLELELRMRQFLPRLVADGHIEKRSVLSLVAGDDDIQFHWCIISASIEDDSASQELLLMIVDLWLTIRGFSSAGSYVEYYKQCCQVSTKKKTSLRKGLKRKHTDSELP